MLVYYNVLYFFLLIMIKVGLWRKTNIIDIHHTQLKVFIFIIFPYFNNPEQKNIKTI